MITWYKSKHNKFNSISGSRYGFICRNLCWRM